MKQILHVFRKDVRHHWIEILLCQAALVAYCWNEVGSWREQHAFINSALSTTIHVLLPLTWGFFVFRIVQSESLVGDRQFWITRPYEWKKLLAEKVMLVLAFINLPLLIAASILLAKAGFSPVPHVLGLLWMQVLLFQLPFLPLLALGAVTRNMAQALLALLAVVLFIILNVVLDEFLRSRGLDSGNTDWLLGGVLLFASCAAIGLQYARRKTLHARVWLAGGGLAMIVITVATAFASRGRDRYPMPAEPSSFHAGPAAAKLTAPKQPAEKDEDVEVTLPIRAWGLAPGWLGRPRGVRLMLEAADGYLWDSGWKGYYDDLLGPGENGWRQSFTLKYKDYERLNSRPLKARVAVTAEILREHDFEGITATAGEFVVPRVGRCHLRARDTNFLYCRSPLLEPFMTVVRVDPSQSTCPGLEDNWRELPLGIRTAWLPGRDSDWPDYGVSPVVTFSFYFSQRAVCPGTPLSFSFPQFVENVRSDFEIDIMNLDEYRTGPFGTGDFGVILPLPRRKLP
jgi:hypothetical protein